MCEMIPALVRTFFRWSGKADSQNNIVSVSSKTTSQEDQATSYIQIVIHEPDECDASLSFVLMRGT